LRANSPLLLKNLKKLINNLVDNLKN